MRLTGRSGAACSRADRVSVIASAAHTLLSTLASGLLVLVEARAYVNALNDVPADVRDGACMSAGTACWRRLSLLGFLRRFGAPEGASGPTAGRPGGAGPRHPSSGAACRGPGIAEDGFHRKPCSSVRISTRSRPGEGVRLPPVACVRSPREQLPPSKCGMSIRCGPGCGLPTPAGPLNDVRMDSPCLHEQQADLLMGSGT